MTVEAFNMAETYRTPVILLFDEVVGHMRERLVHARNRARSPLVERLRHVGEGGVDYHPYLPREDGRLPMSDFGGVHRYNVTGLYHDMWGFPSDNPQRGPRADPAPDGQDRNNAANRSPGTRSIYLEDAECVLISYGSSARSALHVVEKRRQRGRAARAAGTADPVALSRRTSSGRSAARAKHVVVVEMNMGQVLQQVKLAVDRPERVFLANRIDGVFISPTDIRNSPAAHPGQGGIGMAIKEYIRGTVLSRTCGARAAATASC